MMAQFNYVFILLLMHITRDHKVHSTCYNAFKLIVIEYNSNRIRPHKVDLQIIVLIFPIFQAGGQSLFIIHWPISFINQATPLNKKVWHPACKGQRLICG